MKVDSPDCTTRFGRILRLVVSFILYLWQLPQNLLGLLLVEALGPEENLDYNDVLLHYSSKMRGAVSLGRHIIMAQSYRDYVGKAEAHEYGHCKQSKMLGPIYLLVVGIPSLSWAIWWNEDRNRDYYSFYTEKWADRLGEVER